MTQTVNALNLKNIVDDFRLLADRHKQINSFGFGDLDEFSYQVDTRDKEKNPSDQAPYYPYLYVVPSNVIQEFGFMIYEFNLIMSDIMKRDMDNMTDILSDTLQMMNDVVSMFRLSYTEAHGNYNEFYFVDDPITMMPFIERYEDLLCGYSATLRIKTKTYLDRCAAAFNDFPIETPCVSASPTPSITPTNTPTNEGTPTPTPTNTETPTQTPTNTNTETPTQTPTNTETPTQTPTNTETPTPTQTPTNTNTETPTQTPTNTETPTQTPTPTSSPLPSGTTEANQYLSAVVAAGGTVSPTQSAATITLFTSLVSNNLWDKLTAFYPVLGGVQTSHAINGKTPGTNNLVFSGGWTHDAFGMTANGTTGLANTGILHSTLGSFSHASIYNRTNNVQQGYDIGAYASSTFAIFIQTRFLDGVFNGCKGVNGLDDSGVRDFTNTNATGYYIVSRNSNTNKQVWKNGSLSSTENNAPGAVSFPIYIGALNNNGNTQGYVNRQYCFITLGAEVNSVATTLSTIINTYQTSLGRNTY
jgi:hypothetical protein